MGLKQQQTTKQLPCFQAPVLQAMRRANSQAFQLVKKKVLQAERRWPAATAAAAKFKHSHIFSGLRMELTSL